MTNFLYNYKISICIFILSFLLLIHTITTNTLLCFTNLTNTQFYLFNFICYFTLFLLTGAFSVFEYIRSNQKVILSDEFIQKESIVFYTIPRLRSLKKDNILELKILNDLNKDNSIDVYNGNFINHKLFDIHLYDSDKKNWVLLCHGIEIKTLII